MLLVASCSSAADQNLSTPPAAADVTPTAAPPPQRTNGSAPAPEATPHDPTLPRQGTTTKTSTLSDFGPVGTNAFNFLNRQVPKLIVEIDAVEGYEPSQRATDLLRDRLASVVDKPGGIRFAKTGRIACCHDSWTVGRLHDVGEESLDRHSSSDAMVMHVLYVDGELEGQPNAIGAAFESSTTAIFMEQIEGSATPLVSATTMESIVAVHEVGHLLALINIGFESPRKREDPECPAHSANPRSVMTCDVDNTGLVDLLRGNTSPPDDFDADDRADLADIKSGKLS